MITEFEKYIFSTIGEICIKIYFCDEGYANTKSDGFSTHYTWGQHHSKIFKSPSKNKDEILDVVLLIAKELEEMYGFSTKNPIDSFYYINKFFVKDYWKDFMYLANLKRKVYGKYFF